MPITGRSGDDANGVAGEASESNGISVATHAGTPGWSTPEGEFGVAKKDATAFNRGMHLRRAATTKKEQSNEDCTF